MSNDKTVIRRAPAKFTGSARVTLAAISLIGFVGGWNLIARVENQEAQADTSPTPPVLPTPSTLAMPTPTPWPAIAPPPELSPVPTLRSIGNSVANLVPETAPNPVTSLEIAPVQVAPLPTMAPLPPVPDAPPPPPPPPPMPADGWQNSGGS